MNAYSLKGDPALNASSSGLHIDKKILGKRPVPFFTKAVFYTGCKLRASADEYLN